MKLSNLRVAYNGVPGAYSEEAVRVFYGASVVPKGYEDFDAVFSALAAGEVDAALVPIENSIAGGIPAVYDLLYKHPFHVVGEVLLPIRHCLLGRTGAVLSAIRRAHSHPVALQQCLGFLKSNGILAVSAFDTAGSAEILAKSGTDEEAAIASERCAELYGLVVLQRGIAAAERNETRFFALSKTEGAVPLRQAKTSIVFTTRHSAGALVNCLQRFAKHGVNLCKIESRPRIATPWEYLFFADIEGSPYDIPVATVLAELAVVATSTRVLGFYEAAKSR